MRDEARKLAEAAAYEKHRRAVRVAADGYVSEMREIWAKPLRYVDGQMLEEVKAAALAAHYGAITAAEMTLQLDLDELKAMAEEPEVDAVVEEHNKNIRDFAERMGTVPSLDLVEKVVKLQEQVEQLEEWKKGAEKWIELWY